MNNNALYPNFGVLLIDDEISYLRSLSLLLERKGGINHLHLCNDSRQAMNVLESENIGLILLDLTMPHISGMELLEQIHEAYPAIAVLVISGLNNVSTAVSCIKYGAVDYFVKTTEEDRLLEGVKRTILMQEMRMENKSLKAKLFDDRLEHPKIFEKIISRSKSMDAIFHYIESISASIQPVMIVGESGTGKDLIAEACHQASFRTGPLVKFNVAGLDEQAFSRALFGEEQTALLAAKKSPSSLIDKASGGTLFLDNISQLPLTAQVKLLRLLQQSEYYPLGSDQPKRAFVRIIVSTDDEIESMIQQGQFRRDLYYRLCTHIIQLPPLRSRKDDIPILLDHFIAEAAKELGKKLPTYPEELPVLLRNYNFPGNVCELRSLVYDAVSRHHSRLLSMDVFRKVMVSEVSHKRLVLSNSAVSFDPDVSLPSLNAMDTYLIEEAMRRTDNNQSLAARMLGISQPALSKRMKKLKESKE